MKTKKLLSLSLVFVLLISLFAITPTASAVSDYPVKLIYAKPDYNNGDIVATGYVEVKNIAYAKKVTIHYSFDGIVWDDAQAEYYKPTWGNYEAWKFVTPGVPDGYRGGATITFAIKYEVNGQTYWDNNNGKNYSVAKKYGVTDRYDFGSGAVADFGAARKEDNSVYGALELKDLAYEKVVKVVYTTDNWETEDEVNAYYESTFEENNTVQVWGFEIPAAEGEIQYKLSYTVNGITYVNDNFGEYYTV